MKQIYLSLIGLIVLFCSCTNKTSPTENFNWTPDGFKKDHYQEWILVNTLLNHQQGTLPNTDNPFIDSLVRTYIAEQKIELSADAATRAKLLLKFSTVQFSLMKALKNKAQALQKDFDLTLQLQK